MEFARRADGADLPRLAELWAAADAEIGVQRGGQRLVGSISRPSELGGVAGAAELLTDPDRVVVVAGVDAVVLGFTFALLDRRPPVPVAVIEVTFVETGARGIGLGESMVAAVVEWAGAHGCAGVDAYALPGNRPAKAFFETSGFVTRLLTMHRPLPRPPKPAATAAEPEDR